MHVDLSFDLNLLNVECCLLVGYRYYCDPVTICHLIRGGFSILLVVYYFKSFKWGIDLQVHNNHHCCLLMQLQDTGGQLLIQMLIDFRYC